MVVITFTSRHIATAARLCHLDSRAYHGWESVHKIPLHPLASAAPGECFGRSCCQPVTLTLHPSNKRNRKILVSIIVFFCVIFFTVSISYATNESMEIPIIMMLLDKFDIKEKQAKGLIAAVILLAVLAILPFCFLALANYGSGANSLFERDKWVLKVYWYFTLLVTFSGSTLISTVEAFYLNKRGFSFGNIVALMENISETIPVVVSGAWINVILVRGLVTLPIVYLLNLHVLSYAILPGMLCLGRVSAGGGSGGPIPFRIYTDTGTVFLCSVALSTTSPIIAPCTLLYFLIATPIWRRQVIYKFNPQYNSGGALWPMFLEIIVSSLIFMQIVLTMIMGMRNANIAAILSVLQILPTFLFWRRVKSLFKPNFVKIGLFNASKMDDLERNRGETDDRSLPTDLDERERFLKFLVDSHKAAYVPTCIAEEETAVYMTEEPAKVESLPSDSRGSFLSKNLRRKRVKRENAIRINIGTE